MLDIWDEEGDNKMVMIWGFPTTGAGLLHIYISSFKSKVSIKKLLL